MGKITKFEDFNSCNSTWMSKMRIAKPFLATIVGIGNIKHELFIILCLIPSYIIHMYLPIFIPKYNKFLRLSSLHILEFEELWATYSRCCLNEMILTQFVVLKFQQLNFAIHDAMSISRICTKNICILRLIWILIFSECFWYKFFERSCYLLSIIKYRLNWLIV